MSGSAGPSPTLSPRIPPQSGPLPVVHELRISKDAEEWLKTLSPSTFENYDQIQKTWNAPLTQFSLTLVQDVELRGAISQIHQSNLFTQFYGYEAGLILVLWFFRAWRLSKSTNWLAKLWTQAWVSFIYWFLAFLVIPGIIWGEAYRTVLSHVCKAIFVHFIT